MLVDLCSIERFDGAISPCSSNKGAGYHVGIPVALLFHIYLLTCIGLIIVLHMRVPTSAQTALGALDQYKRAVRTRTKGHSQGPSVQHHQ